MPEVVHQLAGRGPGSRSVGGQVRHHRQMRDIRIAEPSEQQLIAVADVRFDLAAGPEVGGLAGRATFAADFARWHTEHLVSHHCRVVLDAEDVVIGFGFLVVTDRVPSPGQLIRRSADIQAVYVVPEHRNAGIGGQLIAALIEIAEAVNAEHLTVHANERAAGLYHRAGITVDSMMLYRAGTSPSR